MLGNSFNNPKRGLIGVLGSHFKMKANKTIKDFLELVTKLYPDGIPVDQFLVLPGYEHVTRDKPVAVYKGEIGTFEIIGIDEFELYRVEEKEIKNK